MSIERSADRISKRPESRPAGRVPNSRAVALRANSLFNTTSHFRKAVWAHYQKQGRHDLPWRKNYDAYHVLVSEIMLQQTQVERVIPFYKNFLKKFRTVRVLAHAPLSEVLKSWQGLGYNRRAKMLHLAAEESVLNYSGELPKQVQELETMPGIGPYTARALAAFAYNQDVVMIETNIRTAIIHHFYPKRKKVSDTEIEKILVQVLPKGKAREWYSALMDYGAHLKRSGVKLNARHARYIKQQKFIGSKREARGAIVRLLTQQTASRGEILKLFTGNRRYQILEALRTLLGENIVQCKAGRYSLTD